MTKNVQTSSNAAYWETNSSEAALSRNCKTSIERSYLAPLRRNSCDKLLWNRKVLSGRFLSVFQSCAGGAQGCIARTSLVPQAGGQIDAGTPVGPKIVG